MALLRAPLAACMLSITTAAMAVNANASSFGMASSDVMITPVASTVFQQSCASGGVVTFSYFQSAELLWAAFDDVIISMFIDGETSPSIQYSLGWFDEGDLVPFGQSLVGSTAYAGGLYQTLRIPFQSSINVTAQLGANDSGSHTLRVIIRGVCGLAVTSFGGVQVPSGSRARLRTSFINGQLIPPNQAVSLASSSAPGIMVAVGLKGSSTNMSFTTGGVAAVIDGATVPLGYDLAGFLAADDSFATGKYTTPISGVTAYADVLSNYIIAWKAFDADVLLWSESMNLQWSIGSGSAGPTTVTAVTWWYEWLPAV